MDRKALEQAVDLLVEARQSGRPLDELPESSHPQTIAEGHELQDALIARLGETVAGWKVAGLKPGEVMRGAILATRMFQSPASIKASSMPLLGIEAEIAFRFEHAMPPREAEYVIAEIIEAATALPAIEIVDSRFTSYRGTPVLDRLGDCMSNGALVCGEARPDWRDLDLGQLPVTLRSDDEVLVDSIGGHANGDPLLPVLALANELRSGPGIAAGQIVTAGSFTGIEFLSASKRISATFGGFGTVEVFLEP
jgi:2-keto-4-pentenoate hydratase